MNTVTLNFRADGQQLVLTGSERFAANTVSYIRAAFELGDGWDGFDSIRAIWATDFAKFSTVLDPDGVCVVPWEVLKRVDTVMVNLVGSISDGEELTDRLTTYKVKALDVNGCTNIDGSETAEITPSQFEQFVAIVKEEVGKVKDISDVKLNADYTLTFLFSDGTEWTTPIPIRGEQGAKGDTGNGISDIEKIGSQGRIDTYRVTYTNGGHFDFEVTNGEKGEQGETGNGIDRIEKTATVGSVDTYTIYFTDGSTTTFTITNGEVTMAQFEKAFPTDTASGSIASFPDGSDLFPMKSLKVSLEPVQDLNGYDAPWVGGAGKNKLQIEENTQTISGVTFTQKADGSIVANGTATGAIIYSVKPVGAGVYSNIADIWDVKPDTQYILSGTPDNGYPNYWVQLLVHGSGAEPADRNGGSSPFSFTSEQIASAQYRLAIRVSSGTTLNNVTFRPMIRLASETDASWTPYSNICPISGWDRVQAIVSPTQDAQDGTTYTADLPQTVYGGWVDLATGQGEIALGYVELGDIRFGKSSLSGCFTGYLPQQFPTGGTIFMCSNYAYDGVGNSSIGYYGANGTFRRYYTKNNEVYVHDDTYASATAEEFKTAMSGVQFVYELAEPIPFTIDPQTIQTLQGANNVWSDGDVEVEYKADVQLWVEKKLAG